jgi:uncharacterized protein YjcR
MNYKRKRGWTMYSKTMTQRKIGDFFNINDSTIRRWKKRGIDLWAIYDAFQNLDTIYEKKRFLYDNNPDRSGFSNLTENFLDLLWETYMERLELEQMKKEKRYESGDTNWKLNQRFGS